MPYSISHFFNICTYIFIPAAVSVIILTYNNIKHDILLYNLYYSGNIYADFKNHDKTDN